MTSRRSTGARKTLSIAEARASLPTLVRRAERGEEIGITRRGVTVAVVRPVPDDDGARGERLRQLFARMRAEASALGAGDDPWADIRDRSPGRPPPRFDE